MTRVGTGIVTVEKPVTGTARRRMGTTQEIWRDMEDTIATVDRATRRAGLQGMGIAMAEERPLFILFDFLAFVQRSLFAIKYLMLKVTARLINKPTWLALESQKGHLKQDE
jgi:hypothetical protein